jgi:hypothetical protein
LSENYHSFVIIFYISSKNTFGALVNGVNIALIRILYNFRTNNMKKLLLIVTAAALTFAVACKKKKEEGTKAPTSYTSKALLEYYSGAWCGYCPDGRVYAENLEKTYGSNKFYYVTIHQGDGMQTPECTELISQFSVTGYPTGMINRIGGKAESRSNWGTKTSAATGELAKCGLAIDATSGSGTNYTVKVKLGIGAKDLPDGSYKMNLFLVKKANYGMGGDAQVNYYFKLQSTHPYYNKGTGTGQFLTDGAGNKYEISKIDPYDHPNAFWDAITPTTGAAVAAEATKAGALSEYSYPVAITNGAANEYHLLAFVSVGGLYPQIYNVQKVEFGANQAFD